MGNITAKVLSFERGLKVYEDVDLIRITSDKYTLLILRDYMPLLGELQGRVEIVSGEQTKTLEDVTGFYIHKSNEFELLITEDDYVG